MIGVIHGYSLEGSGSNLWTRYMIQALCRQGETVHLICQEKSPEKYNFIAEAYHYRSDGGAEALFKRDVPYPGRCIFHRPQLGDVLPVYVGRFLESNPPMLPMNELSDEVIQDYIDRNFRIVREIVRTNGLRFLHVNHAILMSVAAKKIHEEQSVPYAIMPHGSEIEYVIRNDSRFLNLAGEALRSASRVFVISPELRGRILQIFCDIPGLADKMHQLKLGVDTSLFESATRPERGARIQKLLAAAGSIHGGKRTEMTDDMLSKLEENISLQRIEELIATAHQYAGRQPDENLEKKLSQINWEQDSIILYAGRLISGKGIHLLIAALPFIFERNPSSRLLVAGHGPLREALEAFVWALHNGKTGLVEKIIDWGGLLEGQEKSFTHILKFYQDLQDQGKLQQYFDIARSTLTPERVVFTGYLKHQELRHILSCSDVAVFPSIVPEVGPLVFLEALASGCFPIATYFAGAAVQIDLVSRELFSSDAELMKIRSVEALAISDIVEHVSGALALQGKHRKRLREIAIENYDWENIARQWKEALFSMRS